MQRALHVKGHSKKGAQQESPRRLGAMTRGLRAIPGGKRLPPRRGRRVATEARLRFVTSRPRAAYVA